MARPAGGIRAAAIFQQFVLAAARDLPRRRDAEEDAGGHRGQHGEDEHRSIHAHAHGDRQSFWRQGEQPAHAGEGHAESGHRAARGQHHALRERLADEIPTARSERRAHGDLAGAPGRARQRQAGDPGCCLSIA